MIIDLKGTETEIRFGIGFVREIDNTYFYTDRSGTKYGMGLQVMIPLLLDYDIITLTDTLYAGTIHLKKRPSLKDIEDYVESRDDIEELFKEVLEELKNSNATRLRAEKAAGTMAAEVAVIEKKAPQMRTTN